MLSAKTKEYNMCGYTYNSIDIITAAVIVITGYITLLGVFQIIGKFAG